MQAQRPTLPKRPSQLSSTQRMPRRFQNQLTRLALLDQNRTQTNQDRLLFPFAFGHPRRVDGLPLLRQGQFPGLWHRQRLDPAYPLTLSLL